MASVTSSDQEGFRRFREVELTIFGELLALGFFGSIFLASLRELRSSRLLLFPLAMAAGWVVYRRWVTRRAKWRMFVDWAQHPVRRDGALVVQENEKGERTGAIDTTGRYTVRWERFGTGRALYSVSQGRETVYVSTLAPNAEAILKDALQVANYPCEDWPNFDL